MTIHHRLFALSFAGLCFLVMPMALGQDENAEYEFFEAKIRPALVEHCYRCHNSIDLAEADLVLDTKDGTLKGGDGGAIIVPGNVVKSRLIAILKHEVPGLEMPEDGTKLSDATIQDFERWIAMGAPDPRLEPPSADAIQSLRSWDKVLQARKAESWAFKPIASPAVPEIDDERWSSTAVDRFAYQKLRENGIEPSQRADDITLLRRLFFVIVGLPPSSAEVEKWSQEIKTKEGYRRLVDHLLDRPQFGERWARHWMDWTRYADSHGSEGDPSIDNAWHYRDYLIRALNADVPYSQLLREHIAGDLLNEPRINSELGINESLIGTAHWRMVFHGFSPTDALDEKVRFIDDQINTFSKAFLGLTVSCARCHHHKFDPISQEDYYAMFGVLASCRPARHAIDVDTEEPDRRSKLSTLKETIRQKLANRWLAEIGELASRGVTEVENWKEIKELTDVRFPIANILRRLESGEAFDLVWKDECAKHEMHRMAVERYATEGVVQRRRFSDPASLEHWYFQGKGISQKVSRPGDFAVATEGERILTGIYPAGVFSHLISSKDPARLTTEDIQLTDKYQIWMRVLGDGTAQARYVVQDYPRNGVVFPTASVGSGWHWQKFDVAYWQGDDIHLELVTGRDAPLLVNGAERSWFGISETLVVPADKPGPPEPLTQQTGFYRAAIERAPGSLEEVVAAYWRGLTGAVERWRDGKSDDIDAYWLGAALENRQLVNDISADQSLPDLAKAYRSLEAELKVPTRVPGLDETEGRDQELYIRGNHKQSGAKVPRGFLQALSRSPYRTVQSGRLELAEDLLRHDNPLTYRVIVNRIWHHLFGRGLVLTTDNFGKLGSLPTHPELLDYLATDFCGQKQGSFKKFIRELVMSEVWQLSSRPNVEATEKDPENAYVSHANLRRLEAEAIRDSLLTFSGLLKEEMFGPPIESSVPRRSVYLRVQRNALDPFMRAFDFPEPFSCAGRRDVTNVPAQSLAFMNDPSVKDWASRWAASILRDPRFVEDIGRLKEMFITVTGRWPTAVEIQSLQTFLIETEQEQRRVIDLVREKSDRKEQLRQAVIEIVEPARKKIMEKALDDIKGADERATLLNPIGRWDFKGTLEDSIGGMSLTLHNGAKLDSDHLLVGPSGYAVTAPLKKDLSAKTLEAWVQLTNLDQQGGGLMSVQTLDGNVFDAIVFGEQTRQHWLAGSNVFARTQAFGGYVDSEAMDQIVHVAIAYHPDGRIVGFRNGKPYGNAYQSNGPMLFRAGESVIGLGVRHLPAQGNRLLQGKIYRAQLYDRALSAEEIEASFHGFPAAITEEAVLTSLGMKEREEVERYKLEMKKLEQELVAYESVPQEFIAENSWTELARAMFSLKEAIFIR